MDREEVKKIIYEELEFLLKDNKFVFPHNVQIIDGRNIQLGRTTGTQIGTATDQKLAFYGATPVDKPEAVATASGGVAPAGTDSEARSAVNSVISRLQELGLIK